MATKHYIDWEEDGKKTPLHPTLVKIARFISKRTGEGAHLDTTTIIGA
jgi:hypothetical protein